MTPPDARALVHKGAGGLSRFGRSSVGLTMRCGTKCGPDDKAAYFWRYVTCEACKKLSPYCRVDGVRHDYHEGAGGDGHPSHFYAYTCSKCGEEFSL